METQTDTHVHRWFSLLALFTLTLGLWSWGEAATHYSFKGFDVPLAGVVSSTIHDVDYKSGRMVGEYTDIHGLRHGWHGNSTTATQVLLHPIMGINAQKWLVGSFLRRVEPNKGT
jgi:hypothetical protein